MFSVNAVKEVGVQHDKAVTRAEIMDSLVREVGLTRQDSGELLERVLELRRPLAIPGDGRPIVWPCLVATVAADIDPGRQCLERKTVSQSVSSGHARTEEDALHAQWAWLPSSSSSSKQASACV